MSANDSASAQQIAEESRQIAVAMKSDAQSMKLLAITTTIFLPGTFVAGLFSTPIFQRESGAANSDTGVKIWMPGLMLYIAISLPLLLMTLLAWGLWALRYRSKNERDLRETKKRIFLSPGYTEKEALIIRQNAMSQGDL
jgi:Mg2+ and Co2+ transporter CorA